MGRFLCIESFPVQLHFCTIDMHKIAYQDFIGSAGKIIKYLYDLDKIITY